MNNQLRRSPKQSNWIEETKNDGFGLVRSGLLPVLSIGGFIRSATVPSVYLHGVDKMDPSRVLSAMDEIFAERDLRVVRAPVLVYADLLSGYAAATTAP